MYEGSGLLWHTRRVRRWVRPPLVWWRHRHLSLGDSAIVSYPRSGSTWFASMIAELMTGADADFQDAHRAVPEVADSRRIPRLPGRPGRTVRSHEPWRQEYLRTVYLVRDPRDVAVSYYHYRKWLKEYGGSMSGFVRLFAQGQVDTYGRWDKHVQSWTIRDPAQVLVIRFEQLLADTRACLADAAAFLEISAGRHAIDRATDNNLAAPMRVKERSAHSGFSNQTDPRRSFVRSARSGDWQSELTTRDTALIHAAFGPTMARLGYAVAQPDESERRSAVFGRPSFHEQPRG